MPADPSVPPVTPDPGRNGIVDTGVTSARGVVVTGQVATQEMKNRINLAAQTHAGSWTVENRIVVKRTE